MINENGIVIKSELGTGFTFDEGQSKINVDLSSVAAGDIKSANLDGSILKLVKGDNSKVTVDLMSLIPAAKKDQFLKSITLDQESKQFKLVVGNNTDAETTELTVSVSDLLPVTAGNGLEGNGTEESPLKIKTPTDVTNPIVVDGSGISLDEAKLKAFVKETRDVELLDVAGNTIGFCYSQA
nr:MAG: hypothetical protein [Enquatrovirus sp.]